jgi:CheY-like chemotaxis protein
MEQSILLVEDNPDDEELIRRSLGKIRLADDMVVVHDGVEALDYLFATGTFEGRDNADLPTVMLLDLNLPRIGGLEVLRRVRAADRTKRLPVVVLTSSDERADVISSYDLGVNSYVRKPVDFAEFSEAVAQLGLYWCRRNQRLPG